MNGLIDRAIECFLRDSYGEPCWQRVAHAAGDPGDAPGELFGGCARRSAALVAAAAAERGLSKAALMEDLGAYLVTHPAREGIRRLMRFSGDSFADVVQSLDDLPDRVRLALPGLDLPAVLVSDSGAGALVVTVLWHDAGAGWVLTGMLRALADDYGALALLEAAETGPGAVRIRVDLLDLAHGEGRSFSLVSPQVAEGGA